MRGEMLECVEDHAVLAHLAGNVDYAARLFAAADSARKRQGVARKRIAEATWLAELSVIRERLGDSGFDKAWSQGQQWDLNEAIREIVRFGTSPGEQMQAEPAVVRSGATAH